MSKAADDAFLKLAKARFKQAEDADKPQRQRELDDLRFYAGDQWPEDIREARKGSQAKGDSPAIPARPCLTINKTKAPVRLVLNEERQADIGIELVPADDFEGVSQPIDDTEIELREGLVRRIQRTSEAASARSWAFKRAVIAGRGYWLVMTRYAKGKTFDQDVTVDLIFNQASVSVDPAHEQPDASDIDWGFIGVNTPWERFKTEHSKQAKELAGNPTGDISDGDFRALGDEEPTWFTWEKDTRMVRVVDYFYTVRTSRELAQLEDGSSAWVDELPEGVSPVDVRSVVDVTVKWAKINAKQILEETDWPTSDIPIIKVVAEELHPYDQERRVEGMVRSMREPGQGFNAMASKQVEMVALTAIAAPELDPEQIEGYESWWAQSTTRTLPFLPRRSFDDAGRPYLPIGSTPRNTDVQAIAMSLQMFDQAIQSVSTHDPSLGKVNPALKSGRAIDAIVSQDRQGTADYLDNFKRSLRREAQIINNLLYPIYGTRPGRLARIVNGEGEAETVLIHQPFTKVNGKPQAVQMPHPQDPSQQIPMPMDAPNQPAGVQVYKLTKDAAFNVAISLTRNFDTRRQEEAFTIGTLLQAEPQLMTWFGDLYFKNQDGPGHHEMAERAKLMLDPKIQAMLDAKAQGLNIPPQTQAQLAQAKELIEKANQEIQQLQQALQTKQVEQQGKLEVTKLQELSAQMMNQANNERALAVAEIAAQAKQAMADMQLFYEERARLGLQTHETAMGSADAGHEELMAERAHQQALALGAQAGQQALQQGAQAGQQASAQSSQDHAQGLESQVQQAALQPPDTGATGA